MDSLGARILAYLRYCAVKPSIILIVLQAGIFLPCYILVDSIDPSAYLDCDPSFWTGEIWRPLTAVFTHNALGHFLFNMFGLYLLGRFFLEALGLNGFIKCILVAGILANIAHTLLFPQNPVLGFSGAFWALLIASTIKMPKAKLLIFPIPLWLLISVLFFIQIVSFLNSLRPDVEMSVAYDVHVFGGIIGAVLVFISPYWQKLRSKWHQQHLEQQAESYAKEQDRLDELLEKITEHGLHTLTDAEQKFLKKHSEKERKRKESS